MRYAHYVIAIIALLCIGATIRWYTDAVHSAVIDDTWVLSIERPIPQGYVYSTFSELHSNIFQRTAPQLTVAGNIVGQSGITATNYALSKPEWVDLAMNYAWAVIGANTPTLVPTTNNSIIDGLAFDNTDELFAQAQFPHAVAVTNANFPKFYFEPHVHFSTVGTLDATHSNVTWRIEWEMGNFNGLYNKRGTNQLTFGVTNNFTHYIASFGNITNDPPPHVSTIFRCRISRPASVAQDYSNSHDVLLDGLDLHVPVGNVSTIGTD